ncbi:rhomboid-related protein 2-like [Clavelina lepadiformis]|uniref:rhomboid-related protein 2-like n=1 Tax=Clavelina lepadiformis TaxID=159417 RepID=UPI0040429295
MASGDVEMATRGNSQNLEWIFDQYAGPDEKIPTRKFEDIVEQYCSSLSESTIRKLLQYADTNKDGYITKEELERFEAEDNETIARRTGIDVKELSTFKKGVRAVGGFVLPNENDQKLYYEHYSCLPPPLFIILVILAELVVYIYYGATYGEWLTYAPELWNSPLTFDPQKRQEAWRFVSYMLLHAGLEHFILNLIIQLLLGIRLEMVHGGLRVGAIFMAGVLGGSLATSVFDPCARLVGASGGGYSLFIAQLAKDAGLLNGDLMHKLSSLIRKIFVVFDPRKLCSCDTLWKFGYFGYVGYSIYPGFKTTTAGTRVSVACHVAGAIAGLTMGLMVLHNVKKSVRDKVVFWITVAVYSAFMIFAIFWNIFSRSYDNCL